MTVIKFYPNDAASNPDNVLEQAIGEYESVFIIGYDKNGFTDYRSSTNLDHEQILWLISKFQHKLLNGDFGA